MNTRETSKGKRKSDEQNELTCPAKPSGLIIEDITHDRATLKWAKVAGAVRYKVGYTPVAVSENVRYIHVDKPYCTVNSLTPGTEFKFFVIAYNSVGESEHSHVEQKRTKGPPAKPVDLKIEDITHDRARLVWKNGPGPDKPLNYKVGYTPVTDSENVRYVHVKQTNCTVDCLTPCTDFKFFVIAYNEVGDSERTNDTRAKTKDIQTKRTESRFWGNCFTVLVISLALCVQLYYNRSSSDKGIPPKDINEIKIRIDGHESSLSTLRQRQINDQETCRDMVEMVEKGVNETKKMNEMKLKELTRKLDNTTYDVMTTKYQLEELEKAKGDSESKVYDLKKNFEKQITGMETIKKDISELTEFVAVFEKTFSTYKSSSVTFEKKTDLKMEEIEKRFDKLSTEVQQMVKDVSEQIEPQVEKLKKARQEVDKILSSLKSDMEVIKPNTFNKESLTMAFGIVIVLEFGLALWIYYIQNRHSADSSVGLKDMNARDVLERIPRGVALANSVCIISFDEARQREHEALVQSALAEKFETILFVVRRHEHLVKLPKCKFFIMCTEFSERHVIIEEPGLGLGDLKRCTHDAIRKYRANLVILYTRDPGSRNLRGDQLYNNNIYCVSKQPELVDLRNEGHFISTYDALSEFQKNSLKDAVTRYLN